MNFESGLPFGVGISEREMDGGVAIYSSLSYLLFISHGCPTLCSFHYSGWKVTKLFYLLLM